MWGCRKLLPSKTDITRSKPHLSFKEFTYKYKTGSRVHFSRTKSWTYSLMKGFFPLTIQPAWLWRTCCSGTLVKGCNNAGANRDQTTFTGSRSKEISIKANYFFFLFWKALAGAPLCREYKFMVPGVMLNILVWVSPASHRSYLLCTN